MEALAQVIYDEPSAFHDPNTIETTLYNLIESINEEIKPGEDWLVIEVVSALLKTKRISYQASRDKIHWL